jgi:hypothetical protein
VRHTGDYSKLPEGFWKKRAERVKLRAHASEKTSFTAFREITCSGDKLPLGVVAKGKTTPMEAKFGPHPGIIMKDVQSGWATKNLIVGYLQWLHTEISDRHASIFILDV